MNFASVNSMDFQDEFIQEPLLDSFGSFKCGKPLVCDKGCIFSELLSSVSPCLV